MDVQNVTVSAPLVPLACAPSSPVWPTYWGPRIYCTYDRPQAFSIARLDEDNTYDSTTEMFTCNLHSTNNSTLEATFRCNIVENFQHFVNNTIQNVTECIYNTSVVISNVLNPVSEINLVLPRRYEGTTNSALTSSVIRNNYSSNCNVYQVLNCRSVNVNNSLYENDLIDVVNSSLMEPIKCFLTYFDDPVSFDTPDLTNVISSSFQWDWTFLLVILFIVAGTVGNILVCLAVALDRKLQNVTNYFLFSLAIADLLVSLFVMPLGAIPIFLGKYFFSYLFMKFASRYGWTIIFCIDP